MKILLVTYRGVLGNTRKLAEEMAKNVEGTEVQLLLDAPKEEIKGYDVIGFGSAPYAFKWPIPMLKYIENIKLEPNQKVFLFSTSASGKNFAGKAKKILKKKNVNFLGKFAITGEMKLKGVHTGKGRPSEKDLAKGVAKYKKILEKAQ